MIQNTGGMNPNIIYNLCPYLDVKSMLCLSAAYPQWSAIVHDYLKKKFWKLQLMVSKFVFQTLDAFAGTTSIFGLRIVLLLEKTTRRLSVTAQK